MFGVENENTLWINFLYNQIELKFKWENPDYLLVIYWRLFSVYIENGVEQFRFVDSVRVLYLISWEISLF